MFVARAADWVNVWFYGPAIFLPVTLLLLLFPDGRPFPSTRWRPFLWLAIVGSVGILVTNGFDPGTDTADTRFLTSNPFAVAVLDDAPLDPRTVRLPRRDRGLFASPFAMIVRLRRSKGDERRQLTWLA